MHNLLHWRLLVAVADNGTITQAAALCGMTQSAASQAIAQLETMLSTRLLVRQPHNVVLTQSGLQIVAHARTMLEGLRAIQQCAQQAGNAHAGKIRLASFPSAFSTLLPPLLRKFRRLYPDIELITLEGTDHEVESWLTSATADIGVVLNPAPERLCFPLGEDTWLAVVPSAHPLARARRPVALDALFRLPFILATGGCDVNAQSLAQQSGLALADIRATVSDWQTALTLVREGTGVALMPASVIPPDALGVCALPLVAPVYRRFGLACSSEAAALPPVQTLLNYLREQEQTLASR
ncbi:LysR family transcriptional regulator [Serratia marcescens]|jgi:DNA-binding transcriptional LysR family regulator|uniref:LysR-family transcriptional regulator n=1 Tax=Serratia marcescens subsp. marcescens Db11 TaxID=273526 RepID=A0ABC9IFJ2_SERMA|nr:MULTISPECIES: LysR family transcriptional regulator [Serratia]EMB2733403.1 LysR family transcriptional regulator [Serratia marcescens]MBH2624902.1 LysR family transcriptional regulator [Serratia marcescens]MBH2723393.1 LysR family transcriptional regulator [Serratia marcescens]MBH2747466.1 LysR family transcriptional regulator [Serratia marcescens]MBH2814368.1 LysR family transcriptional regulator [Serratia marcescens]